MMTAMTIAKIVGGLIALAVIVIIVILVFFTDYGK
jgi:hypothetical protein